MKETKGKVVVFHARERKEFYYDDKTIFDQLRKLVQFGFDWPYDDNGRPDELQFSFRHNVGRHVEYDKTIASYNLPDNTELVACIVIDHCKKKDHAHVIGSVEVVVNSSTKTFNYTEYTTFADLKRHIKFDPNWPKQEGRACDLYFTHNAMKIEDESKTLNSFKFSKDETILVVVISHAKEGNCYNSLVSSMGKGALIGLGASAAHCVWKTCSSSNLGTSFGSRLLENALPKVYCGIILTGAVLGVVASGCSRG